MKNNYFLIYAIDGKEIVKEFGPNKMYMENWLKANKSSIGQYTKYNNGQILFR